MKTGKSPADQASIARHQIETIVLAACKIKGLNEPDPVLMDAIVSESTALLAGQPSIEADARIGQLIDRIAATMP